MKMNLPSSRVLSSSSSSSSSTSRSCSLFWMLCVLVVIATQEQLAQGFSITLHPIRHGGARHYKFNLSNDVSPPDPTTTTTNKKKKKNNNKDENNNGQAQQQQEEEEQQQQRRNRRRRRRRHNHRSPSGQEHRRGRRDDYDDYVYDDDWTIRRRESLHVGRDPLLSLNLNLDALVHANAPDRAQELFTRIAALHADGYYATAPDVVSFNTVLKGLVHSPSQALDFWHAAQFINPYDDDDDEHEYVYENEQDEPSITKPAGIEPNTRSFNTVLLSLAKAGLYEPAMAVLRQMQEWDSRVMPDRITYNTVLLAFCLNRDDDDSTKAPALAEALLLQMMRQDNHQHPHPQDPNHPSSTTTATTTTANEDNSSFSVVDRSAELNNNNNNNNQNNNSMTSAASAYIQPDVISFNTVIAAWARRGYAKQAKAWFTRMQEYGIRPDVYSYTTVLQAYARNPGGSQPALQLLHEMQQQAITSAATTTSSTTTTTAAAMPNRYTYTAVLRALCQDGTPWEAERILRQIMDAAATTTATAVMPNNSNNNNNSNHHGIIPPLPLPDVVAFTIVIHGWAKVASQQPETAVQAVLKLFQEMKHFQQQYPEMAPNEYTYTALLTTLAQARIKEGPTLARNVVLRDLLLSSVHPRQQHSTARRSSSTIITPTMTLIHFNAWLDVIAKAPISTKARDAWQIYTVEMVQRRNIQGDSITFDTLLAAAANSFGPQQHVRDESLRIGRAAYALLLQDEQRQGQQINDNNEYNNNDDDTTTGCTSLTFLNMFKVLRKYATPNTINNNYQDDPHNNNDSVYTEWNQVITTCLEQGCLNDIVLRYIQEHAPTTTAVAAIQQQQQPTQTTKYKKNTAVPQQLWSANSVRGLPHQWSRHATPERRQRRQSQH